MGYLEPSRPISSNISYAVQWILFALVAFAGWFFFLRREARTVAAEGKDPTWTSA